MSGNRKAKEYLTTQEVAELMRCSKMTVYRLIRRGEFPAERLGTDYRIWRGHFDAWRTKALRKFQSRQRKGA
jgi:putative molybdopterin biosynthesis protein